eukprot:647135-Rhodomonas_salina.2
MTLLHPPTRPGTDICKRATSGVELVLVAGSSGIILRSVDQGTTWYCPYYSVLPLVPATPCPVLTHDPSRASQDPPLVAPRPFLPHRRAAHAEFALRLCGWRSRLLNHQLRRRLDPSRHQRHPSCPRSIRVAGRPIVRLLKAWPGTDAVLCCYQGDDPEFSTALCRFRDQCSVALLTYMDAMLSSADIYGRNTVVYGSHAVTHSSHACHLDERDAVGHGTNAVIHGLNAVNTQETLLPSPEPTLSYMQNSRCHIYRIHAGICTEATLTFLTRSARGEQKGRALGLCSSLYAHRSARVCCTIRRSDGRRRRSARGLQL